MGVPLKMRWGSEPARDDARYHFLAGRAESRIGASRHSGVQGLPVPVQRVAAHSKDE